MENQRSDLSRILIQHIAPIMKVYIVDNDRCELHGARLYAK